MDAQRRECGRRLGARERPRRACLRSPGTAGRGRGSRKRRLTWSRIGDAVSRMRDADGGSVGELVEHRRLSAARRIAEAIGSRGRRPAALDQAVQRRQSLAIAVDNAMICAGLQNRRAMVAERPLTRITSPGRAAIGRQSTRCGMTPMTGGIDEQLVGRAACSRPWCRRSRSVTPACAAAS